MNERENKEKLMEKMIEKISESAQPLRVPKELEPEQIRQKLKGNRSGTWNRYRTAAAAACLCICFGAAGLVYQNSVRQTINKELKQELKQETKQASNQETNQETGKKTKQDNEDAAHTVPKEPVKKLGKMYTLASGYGAMYDTLKKAEAWRTECNKKEAMLESTVDMADSDASSMRESAEDMADSDASSTKESKISGDFSSTNLQVEGVDESDFVKTDGSFVYVAQSDRIQVLDVRSAAPSVAGTIQPDMDEDTDRICEMYAADQLLTVIIQTEKTTLAQAEETQTSKKAAYEDDMQYIDTDPVTKVVTYDITDPENPKQKDTAVQDGWYRTSRKTGGRLYLFTEQSLGIADDISRKEAVSDDNIRQWIPGVNESVVQPDCIYMQKRGNQGLLMASLDLEDHSRVLDVKLLVNEYVDLYVSSTSVYLYDAVYVNDAVRTRIARFALETDGTIQAKAAKTVKGGIEDTFAIHERQGYLQVLTSVTSTEPWENRIYVLDENMQTVGKLTGLARGERIYAARFTGDIGYFVTYRNTDPLFTVDFSDPKEPKIIGELKVDGFSEYLHFWTDNKLLGIGYETNPDNGEMIGVKLSMFDISDPVKVKEEAKLVLNGVYDCAAINDYKAVLVSSKKNVIAFTTETYGDNYREHYRVFSYKNGKFVSRIERTLAGGEYTYAGTDWRSVYIDDRLYLVSEKKMLVFSMGRQWEEIGKLVYGWTQKGKERSQMIAYD